jgi:uncharacterized protein YfiM (DUF2279 family)
MGIETVLALLVWGVAPKIAPPPQSPPSEPVPGWFTEDKLKHFVASFVVSSVSASASRLAGVDRVTSLGIGAGVGATVGLMKERQDARAGGVFSGADLVWDAAGIGASVLLVSAGE